MREPHWLGESSVRVLHGLVVEVHGGDAALRDERRLAGALARPRQQFAYGDRTLTKLAATYAAGIVQGHPFVDGNKRTGFMAAAAFLELNGRSFAAPEVEVVLQTLGLAAGEVNEAQYAIWLEKHTRSIAAKPKKRRK